MQGGGLVRKQARGVGAAEDWVKWPGSSWFGPREGRNASDTPPEAVVPEAVAPEAARRGRNGDVRANQKDWMRRGVQSTDNKRCGRCAGRER